MKKLVCGLLLFCCLALSVSAAGTERVYVLSQNGSNFSMDRLEGELAFWEAPDVLTGQSLDGGVLTLRNETDRTVNFTLTSVSLPYDNEIALTYLDAVTVLIKEGDTVLYHDTFTRLMDAERPPIRFEDVEPGGTRALTFSIACAYTYTGAVPAYESLVWTFEPEIQSTTTTKRPTDPFSTAPKGINWATVAKAAGAVVAVMALAGVAAWIIRRNRDDE